MYDYARKLFRRSLHQHHNHNTTRHIASTQTYDWKGRPLVTTNTDGTTKEISYGGCGCAGGEVTTMLDEVNRRQRTTADILGRIVKTEYAQKNQ
jgi:hypothetical protein